MTPSFDCSLLLWKICRKCFTDNKLEAVYSLCFLLLLLLLLLFQAGRRVVASLPRHQSPAALRPLADGVAAPRHAHRAADGVRSLPGGSSRGAPEEEVLLRGVSRPFHRLGSPLQQGRWPSLDELWPRAVVADTDPAAVRGAGAPPRSRTLNQEAVFHNQEANELSEDGAGRPPLSGDWMIMKPGWREIWAVSSDWTQQTGWVATPDAAFLLSVIRRVSLLTSVLWETVPWVLCRVQRDSWNATAPSVAPLNVVLLRVPVARNVNNRAKVLHHRHQLFLNSTTHRRIKLPLYPASLKVQFTISHLLASKTAYTLFLILQNSLLVSSL